MAAKAKKRASRTGARRATRKKSNLPAGISRIDQASTRTHGFFVRVGYHRTRDGKWRPKQRSFFGDAGHYVPMQATTRHVVGFTRGDEVAVLVTRAPRRLEAAGGWEHQTVILPDGLWRDELTDTLYEGGTVRCSDVFETMPVALLRRVHI